MCDVITEFVPRYKKSFENCRGSYNLISTLNFNPITGKKLCAVRTENSSSMRYNDIQEKKSLKLGQRDMISKCSRSIKIRHSKLPGETESSGIFIYFLKVNWVF